jgi:hypothetical protein
MEYIFHLKWNNMQLRKMCKTQLKLIHDENIFRMIGYPVDSFLLLIKLVINGLITG